jgi:hypothetical protein
MARRHDGATICGAVGGSLARDDRRRVRAGPTGKGVVRSAGAGSDGIGAPGAAAHSNDLRRKGRPDHGERRKAWARWWGASRAAVRRARGCGRPRVQGLRGAGWSRVGVRAVTSAAVRGYGAHRCRRSRKGLAWCQAKAPALPWGLRAVTSAAVRGTALTGAGARGRGSPGASRPPAPARARIPAGLSLIAGRASPPVPGAPGSAADRVRIEAQARPKAASRAPACRAAEPSP